jgi:hypothetical protein
LINPTAAISSVVRDVVSGRKNIADMPSALLGRTGITGMLNRLDNLSNPENWLDMLTGRKSPLGIGGDNPYVASAQQMSDPGVQAFMNRPTRGFSDVEEFIQIVSQAKGYARPTHFELEIMPPAAISGDFSSDMKRINWNCSVVDLPATTLATFERRQGMDLSSIASNSTQYGELNATFMVSEDLIERNMMEQWAVYAADRFNNTLNYKVNYETVGKIRMISPDSNSPGESIADIYFQGLYVKNVGQMTMSYSAGNQILELPVVFGYDQYEYVFNHTSGGEGISDLGSMYSKVMSDPWVKQNITNPLGSLFN